MTRQFRREKLGKNDNISGKILAIFLLFLASFLNNSLLLLLRRESKEG